MTRPRALKVIDARTCIAVLLVALGALVALGPMSEQAHAKATIEAFEAKTSTTQAGGHPDIFFDFEMENFTTQPSPPCRCNSPKAVTVQLPAGFVANPHVAPVCTAADFSLASCPPDSQVGVTAIQINNPNETWGLQPIYNMVPRAGQAGLLAFPQPIVSGSYPVSIVFSARTESDYGLEAKTIGIPRFPPYRIVQIFWGVPADPIHDELRFPFQGYPEAPNRYGSLSGQTGVFCFSAISPAEEMWANEFPSGLCQGGPLNLNNETVSANIPPGPLNSNPTTCGQSFEVTLETTAFDLETDLAKATLPAITGCDLLSFDPSLSAKPTTTAADSASGLDIDLKVPQSPSPTVPSPSQIRATRLTLPAGFTFNPGAAEGKVACSDGDANFGTRDQAECPEYSKIGTLSIESSALPGPLPGYIYLGEPLPGHRYRTFLTADGYGLHIKLPGTVDPDPVTGQLTLTFEDLPQTPLQEFNLHVFGAERGLLTTPTHCGTHAVETEFEPWAAELPSQRSTQFFHIDSGPNGSPCPAPARPFAPTAVAGVTDSTGGGHSEFVLDLVRRDGDQNLAGVSVRTPQGFTAVLSGIPYCSEASLQALEQTAYLGATESAAAICPTSQIGTTLAAAGPGSRPVSLEGRAYLAGPHGGAPLSLAIVTPAVSGPYDLGNVLVRVALHVDPQSAEIRAVSDPLPQIREGIPLRLRRVLVELDRPRFVLNPTDCTERSIAVQSTGSQGAAHSTVIPFQATNCGALGFSPRFKMALTGSTSRRGHPAIHVSLVGRPGGANFEKVQVTLPKGQLLDNSHVRTVCTRPQFAAGACPSRSRIGWAVARSPLLDAPVAGPAYLRSSSNKLPDIALSLDGQVDIEVAGRIDSVGGRLRATFVSLPDLPVSRFTLDLEGGGKGLLINSSGLCGAVKRPIVRLEGQNGKRSVLRPALSTRCSSKSKASRTHRRSVADREMSR
jgi:hypothetical protein